MALLHSTSLYIILPWLYFTPHHSTLLYHGSTSLYLTLHYSAMALLYAIWLWRMYLHVAELFWWWKRHEIQPGFEPGSYEFWSDALTNWATAWSSGIAEDSDGIYLLTQLNSQTLHYSTMDRLHCTWLYMTLHWLYFTAHTSTIALPHSTWLYCTVACTIPLLHSTSCYLTLHYSTMALLHSTWLYISVPCLHLTLFFPPLDCT